MKHKDNCPVTVTCGGQGLEDIPCDCATTHLIDLEDHVIVLNMTVSRYDGLKNTFFGAVSGRVRVIRADDVTIWVDGFAFDSDARVSYDASKDEWSLRVEKV